MLMGGIVLELSYSMYLMFVRYVSCASLKKSIPPKGNANDRFDNIVTNKFNYQTTCSLGRIIDLILPIIPTPYDINAPNPPSSNHPLMQHPMDQQPIHFHNQLIHIQI